MREFFKNHKYILAPMAGINDVIFRKLCIEEGAQLTYTEMISSKGLEYNNEKTKSLLELAPNEEQVVVQLFGSEPLTMAKQAAVVEESLAEKLAYIDINMGCPARKIVKKGDGAALMLNPELATSIVKECSGAVNVPVTAKFRLGYNLEDATYIEFGKRLEVAGASALCLHGRYAMQYYRGEADWNAVSKLVNEVSIPVIGSGDINCTADANRRFVDSKCAAIMVGRAAMGNPQIFAEITGRREGTASGVERLQMGKRHVEEYAEFAQQHGANLAHMRTHCMKYITGLKGASVARKKISTCEKPEDYLEVFDKLIDINL